MDKYTYLIISALLFIPWIIFYFKHPVKRRIIKASIIGGFAGFLAEFWYFRDYWQPPSLFGHSVVSLEDFLFGFTITGVSASCYDVIFKVKYVPFETNRKKLFGILFLVGVAALLLFNNYLGFNSMFVSGFTLLSLTGIIVFLRKDLVIPSLVSGLLSVLIIVPIYYLLFNYISPDYWDKYWLLAGTPYGKTILGNIPLTELFWYFSWGCLAGIAYDFGTGNKKVKYHYENGTK